MRTASRPVRGPFLRSRWTARGRRAKRREPGGAFARWNKDLGSRCTEETED